MTRIFFFVGLFFLSVSLFAADSPQWGIDQGRNRISGEKDLPTTFAPGKKDAASDHIVDAGPNVRWIARLGSKVYTPPVVVDGKVLIGTNNDSQLVPDLEGGHSVLLCLDLETGKPLWHYAAQYYTAVQKFDSSAGLTSTPTVVNDRVYFVNNRGVVCALNLPDGNVLWTFDLIETLGVRQHDTNNCSIVVHDGLLYLGTANGLNVQEAEVERPEAPTFVVLDAGTGRPLARDAEWLKTGVAHGQWCAPALGKVVLKDGTHAWTVFYGTGNGILHGLRTLDRKKLLQTAPKQEDIEPYGKNLPKIEPNWTFNGNGVEAVEDVKPFKTGMKSDSYVCLPPPVFVDNRLYVMFCTDGFTGARPSKAYMTCLDPSLPDKALKSSRLIWKTPNIDKGAISPQAVADGLLYFGDRSGGLHCLDAETGATVWKLDLKGDHWGGPYVADGKVYVGTNRRMFYVLKAGREPEILAEIEMPDAMVAGATAADGILFVPTNGYLYAVQKL